MSDRASRPRIDEARVATASAGVSEEALAWARQHRATTGDALRELDVAAGRHQGDCPDCGATGVLLYTRNWRAGDATLVCPSCVRRAVAGQDGRALCDNDPDHGPAWRNPYTRRNEYLCGRCHAQTEEGVVQNRWARANDSTHSRQSLPLGVRQGAVCEAKGVPGTKPCKGEVKPRGRMGSLLCNAHAGKVSAADGIWT